MTESPRGRLWSDRNFRWLFAGSLVSQLGDQFTLIALPWLILRQTGDTLVLGTLLAVMSVPRALFILAGGALVDRYSPMRVLMLSKQASAVLLALLAGLVFSGPLYLPAVYVLALAIGVASAFSLPPGTSILPTVMAPALLAQANGSMMGARQLSVFGGPLLAGVLIAAFGDGKDAAAGPALGPGLAFAIDAASFAVSAWMLTRVRPLPHQPGPVPAQEMAVWRSVREGLRYCWRDASLRVCFCYWTVVAFFVTGPVQVAIPVLAGQVGSNASAYGLLAGAYGAGTLVGMLVSILRPRIRVGGLGATMLVIDARVGLLFMPLGLIHSVWLGVPLLLVIGTLGGYLQVTIFTWMQQHAQPAMLGRCMALFMFIFMGIAPASSSITGWLMLHISLQQVFLWSGGMLVGIVLAAWLLFDMRRVSDVVRVVR